MSLVIIKNSNYKFLISLGGFGGGDYILKK